jgi:drug/metabolite transporter (DMT)-like permease
VITAAFLRFFAASLILFGILYIRKIKFALNRKLFFRIAYISIVGYSATCVTLFSSYNFISIGLATTMHFVYPAIVTVLSLFVFKEKIGKIKITSLVMSILGVYILASSKGSSISMTGAILALVSGGFYSLYTIELGKEDIKSIDSLLLTFYVTVFSAASIFIFGAATRTFKFNMQPSGMISILGLALICTTFAILAYSKAVQLIGPSDTAILSTFEPVTGVIMGIVIFGERLSLASATENVDQLVFNELLDLIASRS